MCLESLTSCTSLERARDSRERFFTRVNESALYRNFAGMSGSYTISQLHKYEPPKWASSLKNIPQHFVKVKLCQLRTQDYSLSAVEFTRYTYKLMVLSDNSS